MTRHNAIRWVAALAIVVVAGGVIFVFNRNLPDTPQPHVEGTEPAAAAESGHQARKILYWWDPMIPDYRSDKPGKSPMGMDMVPVYADENVPGPGGGGKTVITIPPEVVNNLGVRTAKAQRGTLARRIDTVGYVGFDESLIGHVHLRAAGWIEQLSVSSIGDRVARDQLLFTLYSPTLVNAQEEYAQALGHGNERLIEAARQKLQALGISASQIETLTRTHKVEHTINVYAHHGGVVADLMVREGMYVEPATETMTLVDLNSVWLLAEVFERQADWVEVGQQAEAQVPSMPGRTWTGTVDHVYPSLDPVTRTLKVRLRFDNPDELLKPNMFAHVSILASARPDVLTVPNEAVIRDGESERVILALGNGRFAPRTVTTGIESDGRVEIAEGLAESDEVVVSGQFLLDSEANLRASLERMTPPAKPATDPKDGESMGDAP